MSYQKLFTMCALLFAAASACSSANLGIANNYNVFILGNAVQSATDAEGRVAVGGNATYTDYSVGEKLAPHSGASLVVGGNLSYTRGTVFAGDVHVGGTFTRQNLTINGATYNPGHPIDFTEARHELTATSKFWSTLASVGVATVNYGTINLVGTDSRLNVFHVSGSDLSKACGLNIAAPKGSTVLINIDGQTDYMRNFGISSQVDSEHILYNFYEATSLTLGGIGVTGSILAPLAALDAGNGHIDGTLIGASLKGGLQANYHTFAGDLPQTPVPEPSSLLGLVSGLVTMGLAARYKGAFRSAKARAE